MKRANAIVFLLLLVAGCSGPNRDAEIVAILAGPADSSGGGGSKEFDEHDFGPVPARGQILRHQFTFTNSGKRPVRLTAARATTPCCSEIGPLPKEPVPPGGHCPIPVVLKAQASKVETKRVGFFVQTDSADRPTITYTLRAAVYPPLEVVESSEPPQTLLIGRPGKRILKAIARRIGDDETTLPTKVEAEPPLTARFLGEPRQEREADGVIATVREVEIALPASSEPGTHQGTVVFRWADGQARQQAVPWNVAPPLRAYPLRLVLKPSDHGHPKTLVLRSEGRSFRVTSIDSSDLILKSEFSAQAGPVQTLKLQLDRDRAARDKNPKITIHTDHPERPELAVEIVVLGAGG